MWTKTESVFPVDPTYPRWEFAEIFSTESQCLSKVRDNVAGVKKMPEKFPELKGMFVNFDDRGYYTNIGGTVHHVTHFCVPDSIDPRPKDSK